MAPRARGHGLAGRLRLDRAAVGREPAARLIDVYALGLALHGRRQDRLARRSTRTPRRRRLRTVRSAPVSLIREAAHLRPARCKQKGYVSSRSSRAMQSRCSTLCAIRRSTASSRTSLHFLSETDASARSGRSRGPRDCQNKYGRAGPRLRPAPTLVATRACSRAWSSLLP
jgi:hypothetical protein